MSSPPPATSLDPLAELLRARLVAAGRWVASVRGESKLKVVFVSLAALFVWLGIFLFAFALLRLLDRFGRDLLPGADSALLADLMIERLLAVFALTVTALLVVSNFLVAFATLYQSKELPFLLQAPIPASTLYLGRLVEVVSFSSWALGFLGAPLLLAYGLGRGAELGYFISLPLFFVPFVVIPAATGAGLALIAVRLLAGRPRAPLIALGAVAAVAAVLRLRATISLPDFSSTESVRAVLAAMGQTQSPWLPSSWLSEGLLQAAGGRWGEAVFSFLLLCANAALLVWLTALLAEWLYRPGYSRLASGGRRAVRRTGRRSPLELLVAPLREPMRSLALKDLRLFWRDPAQWSQFLIFFGLMFLYLANLRSDGALAAEPWRSWVSILNTSASMLILATLTTRFIYPLISLEGLRFWILGLAPLRRRTLVWQKFTLSLMTTSAVTVSLALVSGLRLELEPAELALSLTAIVATTAALSGLAVGLGSLYPTFTEDNPSRIVSGLGGTLNFILSFVFIGVVTAIQAFAVQWRVQVEGVLVPVLAGGLIVLLAAATAAIPLGLGIRSLERQEL